MPQSKVKSASSLLIAIWICSCFSFSLMASTEASTPSLKSICKANGLFDLMNKQKLSFTFNVQLPNKSVKRSWVWDIAKKEVLMDGQKVELNDAKFVNDKYWLLFPLVAYHSGDQITTKVNLSVESPLQKTLCTELVIAYVSGKGYTPNDTYKLYVDDNLKVIEWAYCKESKEPPARITSWSGYENLSGVHLSLQREGTNGFKVWFSDVKVE